jgi:hypothetical protein
MNGGNQYWQYEPPSRSPGGIPPTARPNPSPQPIAQQRNTAIWWFLGTAVVLVAVVTAVLIGMSLAAHEPSVPSTVVSQQDPYQQGVDAVSAVGSEGIKKMVNEGLIPAGACTKLLYNEKHANRAPTRDDEFFNGCLHQIAAYGFG